MVAGNGDVLVMTAEPDVKAVVKAALGGDERWGQPQACRSLIGLTDHLERYGAAVAIVDVDPDPPRLLGDLDPIVVRFSETRFVLIADRPTSEVVVDAMRIGARHVLDKALLPTQLVPVLNRLVPASRADAAGTGAVVTVLSASGGCGATTIAINAAGELCEQQGDSSLLVDLDVASGGVALALGLRGRCGIADVLAHASGPDPDLVRSSAVSAGALSVLLSPASVNFAWPRPLVWENLSAAMTACRRAFACTVVDAPRVPLPVAATLAAASRVTLIVMQLSVKDLQIARGLRQGLYEHGVAPERVITLVNRYRRRYSEIGLDQAQRALQGNHIELVGNDYRAVSRSINFGRPLAEVAPRSSVRKDLRKLLGRLAPQLAQGGVNHG